MNQLKTNFLNWRPDADEYDNDGLTKANNTVHDTEGYKPIHLQSAGAFSTGIPASVSVLSVVAQAGIWPTTAFCAYVKQSGPTLRFAHFFNTGTTFHEGTWNTTGYPTAHAFATAGTSQAVVAFDKCFLGDKMFLVAVAEQSVSGGATATLSALAVGSNFDS